MSEIIEILSENNIKNNKVVSKKHVEEILENIKPSIYEVIRVINRKPIFLKEHFERMNRSIKLSGLNCNLDYDLFAESAALLINKNNFTDCNIRVSFYSGNEPIVLMYFIKSFYPSKELFNTGIKVVSVKEKRDNPNIKSFKASYKEHIEKVLKETKAYEALLINDDDTVSEGSRSNVFFVKRKTLITSLDSDVLLGVTREKLVEISLKNGIEVVKRKIHKNEFKEFEAAFITGTSNDVLPIRVIDTIIYNSSENDIVNKVSALYLNEIKKEYE